MDEKKKNLINNTLALFINQVFVYIFPFITVPYLSRVYEVETFGRIFYAQSIIDYFVLFTSFGFGFFAVRELAIHRNNSEDKNRIYNNVFCTQWVLFFISCAVLLILQNFVPQIRADYYIYWILLFQQTGVILYSAWFFQGMEDMKFITILNFIGNVVGIVLTFLLVKKDEDFVLGLCIGLFCLLITGLISFFFRRKYFGIKHKISPPKEILNTLKSSCQFFFAEVAVYFYRQINTVILGFVQGAEVVAYFSTANKLFLAGAGVCYTLTNALFPYMSKNKDKEFFKKLLLYISVFGIVVSICIFLFAKPVICLVYSDKYLEAVKVLQIFSFAFFFNILEVMLGFPFLAAYGYIKETNSCYIFGAVYNTLGLIILFFLNQINLYTVSILAASTCFVMFLHRIYYVLKYKLLK